MQAQVQTQQPRAPTVCRPLAMFNALYLSKEARYNTGISIFREQWNTRFPQMMYPVRKNIENARYAMDDDETPIARVCLGEDPHLIYQMAVEAITPPICHRLDGSKYEDGTYCSSANSSRYQSSSNSSNSCATSNSNASSSSSMSSSSSADENCQNEHEEHFGEFPSFDSNSSNVGDSDTESCRKGQKPKRAHAQKQQSAARCASSSSSSHHKHANENGNENGEMQENGNGNEHENENENEQGPKDGYFAHYVQNQGRKLFSHAEMALNRKPFTSFNNTVAEWESFQDGSCEFNGEMLGRIDYLPNVMMGDMLMRRSQKKDRLYIPIEFPFTKNYCNSLPSYKLAGGGLELWLHMGNLKDNYVTSDGSLPFNKEKGKPLGCGDITMFLWLLCVKLTKPERKIIDTWLVNNTTLRYLVQETLVQEFDIEECCTRKSINGKTVRVNSVKGCLDKFYGPVISLTYVVQRNEAILNNDFFNSAGLDGEDPLEWEKFGSWPKRHGKHLRLYNHVVHYRKRTPPPGVFLYTTAWAPDVMNTEVISFETFSEDNPRKVTWFLQPGLRDGKITVLARRWQVMEIRDLGSSAGCDALRYTISNCIRSPKEILEEGKSVVDS